MRTTPATPGARVRARLGVIVAAGILCAAACGGEDTPSGTSNGVNLTGTWNATYTYVGISIGSVITLTQSGSSLTGTYVVAGGAPTGRVAGTVNGDQVTFRFTQDPPCPGTFDGSGTISNNGNRLTGSYTGSDCSGSLSPSFVANKR